MAIGCLYGNADKRSAAARPPRTPNPNCAAVGRDRATPSNCRAGAQRNLSPVLSLLGSDRSGSPQHEPHDQPAPFPAMMGPLFQEARKASHILYIADNAGEIGFDSLLMAYLKEMGSKISLIVKKGPFFEDATMEDALFFHVDQLVDHIFTLNGFFVPKEIPPALMDLYQESDLIISKGTGNYEALKGELKGKTAIYMLKIKCRPISKEIGADMGSFVVKLEK